MDDTALQAALRFLDSWLAYRARQVDFPGFSVAVYVKDGIVFSNAYGFANLETKQALTSQSLFGIASQSKLFTTTVILQLVDLGKLRLDSVAATYLPWLSKHSDERMSTITIRQLLTHSAGLIRDGLDADFWQLQRLFPDAQKLQDMVLAAPLVLEPNTALKYSNLGFALLGQVIEAVTQKPLEKYIAEHIILPLNLRSTFTDYTPTLKTRLATAYGLPFEHVRPVFAPRRPTRAFAPVVGVHTTAEDMCRFASAHCFGDTRLLSDEIKKEAWRPQWTAIGHDSGWQFGLGFEIQYIGERRVVGHSGHLAGYLTATYFDPKDRLVVAVMANSKDAPSVQIVRGIFEALDWFREYATKPIPKQIAPLNARLCSSVAAVEVVATNERIVIIDPDDWEPFTFCETCTQNNPTTLKITTPGSIMNEGETLQYSFAGGELRSVRYAGMTLLPEAAYRTSLT